jgi:drug/metabolite transporter (DMT)-like permease
VYARWLAAGRLLVTAALVRLAGGPAPLRPPTRTELAALVHLPGAVTAVVFLAWFAAVERLGVERTGLFNGLIPVTSLIAVAVRGTGTVTSVRLVGAAGVLAGLFLGLSTDRAATRHGRPR